MGGQISLSSQPGQGTRVTASLPLALADAAAVSPPQPLPMPGCARCHARILVIDDHAPNRLLLQRQLEHLGHHVATAENGRDGLARLDQATFDVVVCDCAMPVMDGLAFARAVRARNDPAREMPIVGCTASAVADDHAAALAAGMNAVIVKPVGLQALDEAVARACSGCQPLPWPAMKVHVAQSDPPATDAPDATKPGSCPAWCAVCRAMNVACDRTGSGRQ
ncbi:Sensor histidine kinase RcsC [compost metagenome]